MYSLNRVAGLHWVVECNIEGELVAASVDAAINLIQGLLPSLYQLVVNAATDIASQMLDVQANAETKNPDAVIPSSPQKVLLKVVKSL